MNNTDIDYNHAAAPPARTTAWPRALSVTAQPLLHLGLDETPFKNTESNVWCMMCVVGMLCWVDNLLYVSEISKIFLVDTSNNFLFQVQNIFCNCLTKSSNFYHTVYGPDMGGTVPSPPYLTVTKCGDTLWPFTVTIFRVSINWANLSEQTQVCQLQLPTDPSQ